MNSAPPSRGAGGQGSFRVLLFLLVGVGLTLVLWWPAASGRALLAPLDIPPNLFAKYKYLDPAADGIPANHYVIDMILGDLSRNWLVHQAWQRGEMPWWDPYTDGGRPLAAEAHAVNVTDPCKVLLFHLLPFELAYNWARIVTFIIGGVGVFFLLLRFEASFAAAFWGGLLFQFAGCNTVMFSGPTVQAAFAWFPLLWLCWDKAAVENRFLWFVLSAPVALLVFLSGNLQTHSYVCMFALGFWLGYGGRQPARLWFLARGTALAVALGLGLMAPFLFSQVEMLLLSQRTLGPAQPLGMLSGTLSVSAFFPWALGTFRTLDVGKLLGQNLNSLGFWLHIGSAALVVAAFGAVTRPAPDTPARVRWRTSWWLVAIYLFVCSTPLLKIFYTRLAGLAVLGLVVFFAAGWDRLLASAMPLRRWGGAVLVLAGAVALLVNVGAGVIYPKIQPKLEEFVLRKQSQNASLDEASELRKFQVANFPGEVTFRNREPLVAFFGLVMLGWLMWKPPATGRAWWLGGVLVLNILPVLWFTQRFVPQQPIAAWHRLRDGGPEQRRVIDLARERGLRVREIAPGLHEQLFPGALAQLYGVHVLHGHTSLGLRNAGSLTNAAGQPDPAFHDLAYRTTARREDRGELEARRDGGLARFRWASAADRPVTIVGETLTTLTLDLGPGPAADLIRTDTFYPGWRAEGKSGVTQSFEPPCFTRLTIPSGEVRVKLIYEPRWWRTGISVAAVAAGLLLFLAFVLARRGPAAASSARATA